jgi:hypothetical protein
VMPANFNCLPSFYAIAADLRDAMDWHQWF